MNAVQWSQLFCLSFHYGGTVNPWMLSDAFLQFEQEEKEREALEEGGNNISINNDNNNNNTTQNNTRKLFESKNENSEDVDLRLLKET